MKILLIHNKYKTKGGEDQVFTAEKNLLEKYGHDVTCLTKDNAWEREKFSTGINAIWSRNTNKQVEQLLRQTSFDVAHVHNTFFAISPSVYYPLKKRALPIVQTLHNYRLICPNALLFRESRCCEECVGKFVPWPAIKHRCYRRSRLASGVTASMLTVHRCFKTWTRLIDVYISLTQFSRDMYVRGGIPKEKIRIKPNFILPEPQVGVGGEGYVLYVGRLSEEKGISILLKAWERLTSNRRLLIVGDGPRRNVIETFAQGNTTIEFLGRKEITEVVELMRHAGVMVIPSLWYEGFPRVMVEAYATGLPVIASKLGSMIELVDHGRTGLHFSPGNPQDLADKIDWLLRQPDKLASMRKEARAEYEEKYTAEKNYQMLMDIYESVLSRK